MASLNPVARRLPDRALKNYRTIVPHPVRAVTVETKFLLLSDSIATGTQRLSDYLYIWQTPDRRTIAVSDTQDPNKTASTIIHTSDDAFQKDVIESDTPVLVDFWAEWCGPCKMIAPVLDEIATDYEGRVRVVKHNVDDSRQTPSKYGVRSIPTLLLFKNGNVEWQKVGVVSKTEIAGILEDAL
ncbi:MAG: thioredoxin [Gammaproteobacteria bacterium]|nr:thioredoxin [Gammaproteobacteria bacterium]